MRKSPCFSLTYLDSRLRTVYARAGRPFYTSGLADHFADQGYHPRLNYTDQDLNDHEIHNVQILAGIEASMKASGLDQISGKALEALYRKPSPN